MSFETAATGRTGFLVVATGGVGNAGLNTYRRRVRADHEPFPVVTLSIDTDPRTFEECVADVMLPLTMTESKVEALRGSPNRFPPDVPEILESVSRFLRGADVGNGSRTMRLLTQLAWAFHQAEIVAALRRSVELLVSKGNVTRIIPCTMSSVGGGCGSASAVMINRDLADTIIRTRVLTGYDDELLDPPIAILVDPIAHARAARSDQETRILSNAMATRIELDEQMRTTRSLNYAFYLGYSNSAGTVLANGDLMGHVLGTTAYAIHRNWSDFKSRWVDNVDTNAFFLRYLGEDSPPRDDRS